MLNLFTVAFWTYTSERVFKSFVQTLTATLTANGTGLLDTDWQTSLSLSGMVALLSLLTAMTSYQAPRVRRTTGAKP
jgi:hypothetical protein